MDQIFLLGIFLLPFENLFFAPSAGWATITPIIWVIYICFNLKLVYKSIYRHRYIIMFFGVGILLSLINYLRVGIETINIINSLISLGLGLVSLISFDIYFIQKEHKLDDIVNILLISYTISLLIGCLQYICITFNLDFIKEIFINIEKRSYIRFNRVQYTFTEPSFIGMHLFGILLPIYLITKNKKLLKLIIVFSLSAILFSSGVRILLDIIVTFAIMLIAKNINNIKVVLAIVLLIPISIVGVKWGYNNNYRVKSIIDDGIYADGSLASRYFRINASIKGYKKNWSHLLFGYGLGNSLVPLREGYDEARREYKSSYIRELNQLADANYVDDSVSYCVYIRIISEFGIIMFVIMIMYILGLNKYITKNSLFKYYIIILLYIYLQFESYAFYTIWLYIIICNKFKIEKRK